MKGNYCLQNEKRGGPGSGLPLLFAEFINPSVERAPL